MSLTVSKPSITLEAAQLALDAAEKAAEAMGHPMVIAIVDESGVLKAFRRMDGAALLSVDIAQDKAFTARAFDITTKELATLSQPGQPLSDRGPHAVRLGAVEEGGHPTRIRAAGIGDRHREGQVGAGPIGEGGALGLLGELGSLAARRAGEERLDPDGDQATLDARGQVPHDGRAALVVLRAEVPTGHVHHHHLAGELWARTHDPVVAAQRVGCPAGDPGGQLA